MLDFLDILGWYSLVLIILGTIGNVIICHVSVKTNKNSTFILLRYLAINDMIALYYWNLNNFTKVFSLDLLSYNLYSCKIGTWIQFSSLQSFAWILVYLLNIYKFYS